MTDKQPTTVAELLLSNRRYYLRGDKTTLYADEGQVFVVANSEGRHTITENESEAVRAFIENEAK